MPTLDSDVPIIGESDHTGTAEDAQASDETVGSMEANIERHSPASDPVANQRITSNDSSDFDDEELEALLDTTWLQNRVVEDYARYATKERADFDVTYEDGDDEDLEDRIEGQIEEYFDQHNLWTTVKKLIEEERGTGDGIILPVITERTNSDSKEYSDPLDAVGTIKGFNVIGQLDVNSFVMNLDPLAEDYRQIEQVHVDRSRGSSIAQAGNQSEPVHNSRFIHLRTRWSEEDPKHGLSVWRRARTLVMSLINAEWSMGQIIFRAIFKVLKTSLEDFDNRQQRMMANKRLERDLDALSLSIIGREDELEFASAAQNIGGLSDMIEQMKDFMQAAWAIPKSILFGAQSGTLSASDRDAKNFFQGIKGFQESELTPIVKDLIQFGWGAKNGIGPEFDGKEVSYEDVNIKVNWNKLFEVDEADRAEIEKTEAQAKQLTVNYLTRLVASGGMSKQSMVKSLKEAGFEVDPDDLPDANTQGVIAPQMGDPEGGEEEQEEQETEPDTEQQEGEPVLQGQTGSNGNGTL
jgi:phage-related protein (TIGR01555 family)